MEQKQLKNIIEAVLLAAVEPLSLEKIRSLFPDEDELSRDDIRAAILALREDYAERGIELKEVASGFRVQVKEDLGSWVSRLWDDRPPKYSRALLETLALIAYRQPITRAEIEDVRGVAVSTSIMKTLQERDWVRIVGHRDVPGRPGMYATTREFLDYFNLKSLDELPSLKELQDLDKLNVELDLDLPALEIAGQDAAEESSVAIPQGEAEGSDGDAENPPDQPGDDTEQPAVLH